MRLAAVRRLAYEAADSGLLSPELAAGIRRVKGAQKKKLGVRLGNWLTADEARRLWQSPGIETLKGKRDRALLAVLLGCGLRRRELAELTLDLVQRREDHWAIVDLVGKAGHIRTVPLPDWVKQTLDDWLLAAGIVTRHALRIGRDWPVKRDTRKTSAASGSFERRRILSVKRPSMPEPATREP